MFKNERKQKKSTAWKVDLEIGTDIRIPIAGYVAVRRENAIKWKMCIRKDSSDTQCFDELKAETTIVRNNDDQEVVEPENLIDAYKYGSKLFTISEVEKAAKIYESGPKSLMVVGFVKRAEVPVTQLIGDGYMMFQAVKGSEYSINALSSLVEAMVREGMVAIVRRVYVKNSAPKLAALIPEDSIDIEQEERRTLVYIELPFSDDLRSYKFSPLWNSPNNVSSQSIKSSPTEAQLKAVDNLIDCMMLDSEEQEDDENCLKTEAIPQPFYLYHDQCISSRIVNPRQASIAKVDECIKDIMAVPESIIEASLKPLATIAELFELEVISVQKKKLVDKMPQCVDTKK